MKLVLVSGDDRKEYLLGQINTIGRHSTNSIQILDGNISKEHAEVLRTNDGRFLLKDKDSLNGTYVGGEPVKEKMLDDGDEIAMGSTIFQFITRKQLEEQPREDVTIITNLIESNIRERIASLSSGKEFLPADRVDPETVRVDYEKLRVAHELARTIASELDEEKLLPKILDHAFDLLPAERGVILLKDEDDEDRLKPTCTKRKDGRQGEIALSRTILSEVVEKNTAVLSADAKMDNRFDSSKSVIREGIRSTMAVPLLHGDDLLGVMHLDSLIATNAFSEKDLQIFQVIANQAAVSIANCRMARVIKEEAKQRAVLGRLLSPALVQEVITGNLTVESGGERRNVTILFADIRGFTAMAEGSDPTEIVEMLNDYFDHMVEVLFRHGGTIDKYVGDEIMGLFGAPIDMPDAALEAVRCGWEMQEILRDFNAVRRNKGKEPIHVGIGIDTGDVVCGLMGATNTQEGTLQYTAIGDSVNTASRLCDLAEPGQILISQRTLDRVTADIETKLVSEMQLKGKRDKVLVFRVTSVTEQGFREDTDTQH